ncbi:TetR/AcrR family transcriptional regulator [Nonomuraea jiangxiensis]|uniref:DNA-binding transcriptional regulator, AcrR family n=1 Tax=Nonomuraea jiangxiensis TaxID=633440 RepID=A0A1G9NBW4_9ACTN|nr:TetR/AcrR family transcriptional regulator [Nonomuraea jiangxiensis]SDL83944.1 DNA-binding transcriptional regulator, AcrR family [Nonomuraea jiangxiensis]
MPGDNEPFPSVWARPRPRRREQPALSREQIVAAALELLDTEGIDALSMRRLGTRLNAGATSMYTHVAGKEELLELVVDEVYGEVEPPVAGAGWRVAVTRCAHGMRSAFLRHPWIGSVQGEAGVAYLGPNVLRLSEAVLAVFEEGGFSLEAADQALNVVMAYVIGRSTSEAAWLTKLARGGQDEQEWAARLWPAAEQAVRDYPRLRRLYAAQRGQNLRGARDQEFDDGLACVLDGLATRLKPKPEPKSEPAPGPKSEPAGRVEEGGGLGSERAG